MLTSAIAVSSHVYIPTAQADIGLASSRGGNGQREVSGEGALPVNQNAYTSYGSQWHRGYLQNHLREQYARN